MNRPDGLARLRGIVKRLRSPGGCPWDRAQTHRSIKSNLLEETYEVLEALERDDPRMMEEELGDLLLQVVFHARIEEERGRLRLEDVIRHVSDKLIRRHPHVFGRGKKISAARALSQWERLKRDEKPRRSGLDGVPQALPALLRATRVQSKAARLGFEWRRVRDAWAKFDEESGELKRAVRSGRRTAIHHELGDALFALAKVAKFLRLDPEDTLQAANDRFIVRFHRLEREVAATGRKMHDLPVARLQRLWRSASRSPERAKGRAP